MMHIHCDDKRSPLVQRFYLAHHMIHNCTPGLTLLLNLTFNSGGGGGGLRLSNKLPMQGYVYECLKSSLMKSYGRFGILANKMKSSSPEC